MNQAPGAINFTMFLTLFGERLQGTDPEDVIRNAFACFDENNAGESPSHCGFRAKHHVSISDAGKIANIVPNQKGVFLYHKYTLKVPFGSVDRHQSC